MQQAPLQMKNVLNHTGYWLGCGIWYLMSLLPFRVLYIISDLLYLLVAHVGRYRHRIIRENLAESFPEKTEAEIRKIQRDFYHWLCDYLVETVKLRSMSQEELRRHMRFTGMEPFNAMLERGESCAVYLGHYCNWEWITSLPCWIPEHAQCCQIYHPLENETFDRLFKRVRERQNARCIPMRESLRKILEYKRGHTAIVVGYIADQVPLWQNIHHWVDFLHHDTPVFTGSERIIKRTKQMCFYGDVRRIKRGYYECEMTLMTDRPEEAKDFEITDMYFGLLEKTIRRDPALWLWSHNRWKRTRKEFNERFMEVNGKVVRINR